MDLIDQIVLTRHNIKEILVRCNNEALEQVNAIGREFLVVHDGSLRVLVGKFPDCCAHITSLSSYGIVGPRAVASLTFKIANECVEDHNNMLLRFLIILHLAPPSSHLV